LFPDTQGKFLRAFSATVRDDGLADMRAGREIAQRFPRLLEGEDAVDDGPGTVNRDRPIFMASKSAPGE
jgi:hypothetical protein